VFVKSVRVAVAVLAAGAALTACGPVKAGTAAIVDKDRITVAKLDSAVTQWAEELPKYPAARDIVQRSQDQQGQGQQIPFDPSSPQRSALHQLLDMRAWDEVADEHGMAATPGQVESFVTAHGGWSAVDANVLAQGLPTKYSRDYARTVLIQQSLVEGYGGAGQSIDQQKQQQIIGQIVGDYTRATRRLGIEVNPRYGSFDDQKMTLGQVCPHLSVPDSGTGGSANEAKCQD
jgi:hypothetical protein